MKKINISRSPLTVDNIKKYLVLDESPKYTEKIKKTIKNLFTCSYERFVNFIFALFPVINVVKNYEKSFLLTDIFGGLTVASIVIPLGLTHSQISMVDLQYGIYTSIYPPIIYFFIGKSHAAAFGSFAIISIMTGTARQRIIETLNIQFCEANVTYDYWRMGEAGICFNKINFNSNFVSSLTLLVGIIEILMSLVKFGDLSVLLAPSLVAGYTTGGAFHILFAQITNIFVLPYKMESCTPAIICKSKYILGGLKHVLISPIVTSTICLIFLILMREFVLQNTKLRKFLRFRIPSEFLAIVIAILVVRYTDVAEKYSLPIVGPIPQGYPTPAVPSIAFWKHIFADAIPMAIVCWSVTTSIMLLFAEKKHYTVNVNAELCKYGFINVFGGFFHGLVATAALSRSFIFESVSQTQFAGLVGGLIILLAVYFIGNIFQYLPICILSTICIVALHGLFRKLYDLKTLWKHDKSNFILFLGTFISVIFSDLTIGLICGLVLSTLILLYRSYSASVHPLYPIPGTEIFEKSQEDNQADCSMSPQVLRLPYSISYLNVSRCIQQIGKYFLVESNSFVEIEMNPAKTSVILDFSSVIHIDFYSLQKLAKFLVAKYEDGHVIIIARINGEIYEMLENNGLVKALGKNSFVPTLYDAQHEFKNSVFITDL